MTRYIICLLALIGFLVSFTACGKSSAPKYTPGQELTLSGKIKIIDNDGEAYVLVNEKNEYFDVHQISEEYKKEGTPIKIIATIQDLHCLHGAGPSVIVKEYLK